MYLTIEYVLCFHNPNHKNHDIQVIICNHQITIRYNNLNTVSSYRVITNNNDEHEVISMITHYIGMGYTITKFKRNRLTIKN